MQKEINMENFDKNILKKKILDFTINGVEKFLEENPELQFYAFAYDCNVAYAEINLCFNTPEDFQETLFYYQNSGSGEGYKTEEDIKELKYNTGDWEYQCFDTLYIYSREELDSIYNNICHESEELWNEFLNKLLDIFCEVLLEFRQTAAHKAIPKTKDFIVYCIDHDESFEEAEQRMIKVKETI
jgi:hypothetical protein